MNYVAPPPLVEETPLVTTPTRDWQLWLWLGESKTPTIKPGYASEIIARGAVPLWFQQEPTLREVEIVETVCTPKVSVKRAPCRTEGQI